MAFQKKNSGKKDGDGSFLELKAALASGELGTLYLFHGEETYLRDYYLGKMKEALLTGGLDDFNYHTISAKEFSLSLLREYIDAMPMMSERTMVVVSDVDIYKGDREGLMELFSDLPEYICLIFVYDIIEYKPDGRAKLSQVVKSKGKVVCFAPQDQDHLVGWIARRFHALGHDIGSEDAKYLIFLCGDLMNTLIPEISKIGTYAKGKRVTREDIDAVAIPQLDAVVFQLTDAVAVGDFDRAFSVLGDLLNMQEAPIMILSVLGKQLRQLYTARLAVENRKNTGWLMELWGMKSSYPAEKLMASARKFSLDWCRRAVLRCEELDLTLKSTGTDGREALTVFLLELSAKRIS